MQFWPDFDYKFDFWPFCQTDQLAVTPIRHRYQYLAKKVADKVMVRMHKSYKRQFCQRCFAKYTQRLSIKNHRDYMTITCKKCYFSKNYPLKQRPPKKR